MLITAPVSVKMVSAMYNGYIPGYILEKRYWSGVRPYSQSGLLPEEDVHAF